MRWGRTRQDYISSLYKDAYFPGALQAIEKSVCGTEMGPAMHLQHHNTYELTGRRLPHTTTLEAPLQFAG
jgi:hypothetical protein